MAIFFKNGFPAIFGNHLEFLHKVQKGIYLRKSTRSNNSEEIFNSQGIHRFIWHVLAKVVFPPFLAAILNFCIKCKSEFISEAVADQNYFEENFWPTGYIENHLALFQESIFLPFFAGCLNFCINGKKHKTKQSSHFSKIFNAHWDPLFLLCKNNFVFSCKAILQLFLKC